MMGLNVYELEAVVTANVEGYKSALDNCAAMGKNVMGGIGKIAKVGFGVATAAIGAGTAAMGAFGKSALESYSNYEQLTGGVEKLYGTASQKLMQYAKDGYKTAGMSANQYMETATSFSAALIKSLGGDVDKAADMTDVAMKAMSDNVNVFGSDMTSVQNAFQGFAKQNYTMLDNLKLGYGGTKEEMQKLIADANEYRASIGETSDLTIESFADIVTAIQTVQEQQNIAGTTAKEAMTTIEGSANMTKAAWENLVTAVGSGEGITEAFSGLKDAIFGVGLTEDGKETGLLNQIIPRIQTIMDGAGDAIVQASPLIAEKLPELIEAILPPMIDGGISLAGALGKGLLDALPSVWKTVEGAAGTVGDYLYKGMETAAQKTEDVDFATPINAALDKVDELLNGEKTQKFIENGVTVVTNLATGIGNAAPDVIPKAAEIVTNFANGITDNIPQILEAGGQMALGLAEGIVKAAPKLLLSVYEIKFKVIGYFAEMAANVVKKAKEGFGNLMTQAVPILNQLPEKIAYYAGYAVTRFATEMILLPYKAKEFFNQVIDKAKEFVNEFPKKATEATNDFKDKFKAGVDELLDSVVEWGKSIAERFLNGIKSVLNTAGDLFGAFTRGADAGVQAEKQKYQGTLNSSTMNFGALKEVNTATDMNGFSTTGLDYNQLGKAVVKAFTDAEIAVECDDREFGRLVRKAVFA